MTGSITANGAATFNSTLNVAGSSTLSGNVVAGDGTGDHVTINTAGGGVMTMIGLPNVAGTDVLMANGANVITRAPIAALINADQGITYNEGGTGSVRLGATTTLGSPLVVNRFVNLAANDLTFTTNGGNANLMVLDGGGANYGITMNAAGTGSVAINGTTNIAGATSITGATTQSGTYTQSGGQVTFNGNVDANSGVDVTGATTMNGSLTQTGGNVSLNGPTTVNSSFTQTGVTNQVTLNGNVDANSGIDVTGASTFAGTIAQTGAANQVTFNGNVDATNGLDVTGQNLTVGGANFSVVPATGNTSVNGTLTVNGAATLNGNVNMGNGTSDNVVIDVAGGAGTLRINGLPAVPGNEILMINAANVVSRSAFANLIDADQGLTYNDDGTGRVRLGSTVTNGAGANTLQVDRNINLGNFDLRFTTSGGANNIVVLDGGAVNYGATINAGGTGAIALNGPTNVTGVTTITGNTTIAGTVTQNGGGQVSFSGNVDANSGVDVTGALTVAGPSTLTGNLTQQSGTVTIGGTTTINGGTTINNSLNVTGATTLQSSLAVNGNTTIGDAAADNLTVNAATVTMANLPTTTTVNNFIMRGAGGALQVREINNIVTGTGTPNRLTRWDANGTGILDASLSDDGAGNLTRTGNIAINPGAAFTVSTNGNLSVGGASTLTGTANMNGAVNIGNGGDAVAVNVSGSQMTMTGINTAVGTDVMMLNGSNVVSRTPITSLIDADQGVSYNEGGAARIRLGSAARGTNPVTGNRFVDIGTTGRLTFTTNNGNAADDMLTLSGGTANYGITARSKGTGKIDLKSGAVNGVGDVTAGSYLSLAPSSVSAFKYVDAAQEMGVVLDPSSTNVVIIAEDIAGGSSGELRVTGSGLEFSGTLYQATPDLVQFSGNVEMARKLDVVGNFAVFADRFTVDAATGNTSVRGTLNANGAVNLGDGIGGDAVTANVTGSTLRMIGLGTTPGADLLMINGTNVVSRTPLSSILGADEGITYDEGGSGKMRLGSVTNGVSPLTSNRFVSLGNFDLNFTSGAANVLTLDGGAGGYGATINAAGTGLITINGGTNINVAGTAATSIGNTTGVLNLRGSSVNVTGRFTQAGGDVTFTPGPGRDFNVTTDGAVASGMAFSMNSASGVTSLFSKGAALNQENGLSLTPTEATLYSFDLPGGTSATVETQLDGDIDIQSTGTTTITGTTRIIGATSINTSAGQPATSIGNGSSTVSLTGSTASINATGSGSTTIGNNGANASTVTISAGSASGNIVMNGLATDAVPTEVLTINGSNQVRRTSLPGTARQGVSFASGQYRLGAETATDVPFLTNRFVNVDNNNLSITANAGTQTPLQVVGGANSGVNLRASGGSGTVQIAGTTNINSSVGSGVTTIGNTSNPLSLSGSTVDVRGTTTINTSNTSATSIGNTSALLTLVGSAVDVTGNVTANNNLTVTGTSTLNGVSNLNGAINLGNGDGDVITV
ncbi:MAG: beta strand repeat-containing protein, partial [Bacteroidota bacterium]